MSDWETRILKAVMRQKKRDRKNKRQPLIIYLFVPTITYLNANLKPAISEKPSGCSERHDEGCGLVAVQ